MVCAIGHGLRTDGLKAQDGPGSRFERRSSREPAFGRRPASAPQDQMAPPGSALLLSCCVRGLRLQ
jgi:hypothetical protein